MMFRQPKAQAPSDTIKTLRGIAMIIVMKRVVYQDFKIQYHERGRLQTFYAKEFYMNGDIIISPGNGATLANFFVLPNATLGVDSLNILLEADHSVVITTQKSKKR